MQCDLMAAQTQPLEKATVGRCSRDEGADKLPALTVEVHLSNGYTRLLTVLADEPNEYLQVAYTPVALQLASLGHPKYRQNYF